MQYTGYWVAPQYQDGEYRSQDSELTKGTRESSNSCTLTTPHSRPEHIPPSTRIRLIKLQTKWLVSMTDSMNIVESVLQRRAKEVGSQNMDYWDLDKILQAYQNSQSKSRRIQTNVYFLRWLPNVRLQKLLKIPDHSVPNISTCKH